MLSSKGPSIIRQIPKTLGQNFDMDLTIHLFRATDFLFNILNDILH